MGIKMILSGTGTIISVCNAAVPSWVIYQRRKTEEINQIPLYYLKTNHLGSIAWLLYSCFLVDIGLILVNSCCSLITFLSIFLHSYYTVKLWQFYVEYLIALLVIGSMSISMQVVSGLGVFCTIVNILTSVANLESIHQVYRTSNYECIDIHMAVSNLVNAGIWLAYGIIILNLNVIISNAVVICVAAVLIGFHTFYRFFNHRKSYTTY